MNEAMRHFISIRQNEYMELHLIVEDGQIFCAGIVNRKTGYVWENPGRRVPLLTIPGFDFRGAAVSAGPQGDSFVLEKEGRSVSVSLKTWPDNPFMTLSVSLSGVFGQTSEKTVQDGSQLS